MGTINRVVILGVIGRTPELKWSRNGKPFVRLSLATHKRTKDLDGNNRRETQWHKVMLWGKNAEICSTFCEKGTPLYVEGHLAPYTKEENGAVSHHISIVAEQIQFIPGSKSARSAERVEFEEPSSSQETEGPRTESFHEESTAALN